MHEENKFSYRPLAGGKDAEWHFALGLDDVAKAGSYAVRLFHRDLQSIGIETNECDKEHYTFAHLLVSESAATGKQQTVRTIGQTLFLTICATNEVKALTRTCELTPQGAEWTPWSNIAAHNIAVATVPLKWGADSSINNYTTAGTYSIAGERLNANDGLPIANSNPGHTIHARLTVLDSSIAGTGDSHDKCVTQVLTLSNRTGGDGDVYIRTGRASIKNQLAGGTGWEPWGKLQQNIEVGQVTSLDTFTGNGIYSGVYTNGSTFFETFVMVVINNYPVAGATGQVMSISQFKYALNVDGTFSYKTRTGQGSSVIGWGSWVDLGAATTTDIQDGAITAQKLSSDVREKVNNPLRPLYIAAGAEYNDSGADKTKTAPWGETVTHKAGHYYLNGLGDITEEQMMAIYNAPHNALYPAAYTDMTTRTLLWYNGTRSSVACPISHNGIFFSNANLETIGTGTLNSDSFYYDNKVGELADYFRGCTNLKHINITFEIAYIKKMTRMFDGCVSLITTRLNKLPCNVSLGDSPNISKGSILHAIVNAQPTAAITVTLHHDAYTRLADDAEIVAALEAQPMISLVSA